MPSPTSGCPNIAFSEQIRISQLIAISHPPPSAKPLTAAITGIGNFSSFRNTSFPFFPKASPSAFVRELISAMSAPATKDFSPAPVRIKARISSRSTASRTSSSSPSTALFKALSAFGREIVIRPICPSASYVTNSMLFSPSRGFLALYDGSAAHSSADTQRGKALLGISLLHLMEQRYENTASRRSYRMS